ncbi:MAG: hypothetical protein ACRD3S_02200, partial [Terracidiphilus sp.]
FALIILRTPLNNPAFRDLERDCRACQAVFFVAIVAAVFYYGIPVGRTLKAICLGYGLYVGVSLIALTVSLYGGDPVSTICAYLQAASFDVATIIWLVGLWTPGEPETLAAAWRTGQGSESGERPRYSGVRSGTAFRNSTLRAARA